MQNVTRLAARLGLAALLLVGSAAHAVPMPAFEDPKLAEWARLANAEMERYLANPDGYFALPAQGSATCEVPPEVLSRIIGVRLPGVPMSEEERKIWARTLRGMPGMKPMEYADVVVRPMKADCRDGKPQGAWAGWVEFTMVNNAPGMVIRTRMRKYIEVTVGPDGQRTGPTMERMTQVSTSTEWADPATADLMRKNPAPTATSATFTYNEPGPHEGTSKGLSLMRVFVERLPWRRRRVHDGNAAARTAAVPPDQLQRDAEVPRVRPQERAPARAADHVPASQRHGPRHSWLHHLLGKRRTDQDHAMQRRLIAALIAAGAAGALAQDPAQHGSGARCLAGDCHNGTGTLLRGDGNQYTGAWSGGRFAGGTYQVRWAVAPEQTHPLRMDAEGLPLEGTMVRGLGDWAKATSSYAGTFTRVWNPFLERHLASFATGRYLDAKGNTYDGEFQYIPSRAFGETVATGIFLFQGVRIDPVEDEVIAGLFISDPTVSGANIVFYRARPDFIAKLQQDFAFDKQRSAQDKADQASSQAAWGMLLNLTLGAAAISGGGRGGLDPLGGLGGFGGGIGGLADGGGGSGKRLALNLLGDVLRGVEPAQAAADRLAGDLQQRALGAPQAAAALGLGGGAGAPSSQELAQRIGRSLLASPRTLTVKEYQRLLLEAAGR